MPLDGELALALTYEDEKLINHATALRQIILNHPGKTPVCIKLRHPTGTVVTIALADRVSVTEELLEEVEKLVGTNLYSFA